MVTINKICKNYGDFHLQISMELKDGMVTGIVGRNGAGKTTTIKSILGLVKPDSGSVQIFHKDATEMTKAEKEKIGVAFSDSGFSTYLSVSDIAKVMNKMYQQFDKKAFLTTCREQNLPLDKKIKEFSTGMKAKLKVLIAISHASELLVLDEPTAGLDVIARNQVLDLLRDFMEANPECSVLISSHISSDLEGICDDIYMVHEGQVVLHEDTDVLLSEYAVLKVSRERFETMDQKYILQTKEEPYGYICLTNQKQYYLENYPDVVIENGNIDDVIIMMSGGK